MPVYLIDDVFAPFLAIYFRGQIFKLAAKQDEIFQIGQQEFERGKLANAEAGSQVERLEQGEACQRGDIAELVAPIEVERLERGEAGQRRDVDELVAPGEVE